MSLHRSHITAASRIMLPTYVAMFAALGLNYLFTPAQRLSASSTALDFADRVMPIQAWGLMFLAAAVIMAGSLMLGRRVLFRFSLWVCAVSMTIWAVILFTASLTGEASPAAAIWPAFVAMACIASARSLLLREV